MAKPRAILVSALAGPPAVLGRVFPAVEFFDAIEAATRAAQAGYDGRLYVVFDDDLIREFRRASKDFGAVIPNPFE